MPSTKLISLLALAASAYAAPSYLDSPIPGYAVVDARWNVEVAPGNVVEVRGTVEQAIAEITARHDADFETKVLKRSADEETSLAARSPSVLMARASISCPAQAQWAEANGARIAEGIRYLRGIGGSTNTEPGRGYCTRVSCSWDAAIWLCNDNTSRLRTAWTNVANTAQGVVDKCQWCYSANNAPVCWVKGQHFTDGNWNVIVRKDSC